MAITKIWNIAKSKDGNLSNSLHRFLFIYRKSGKDGWRCISGRCKCNAGCRAGIRADV